MFLNEEHSKIQNSDFQVNFLNLPNVLITGLNSPDFQVHETMKSQYVSYLSQAVVSHCESVQHLVSLVDWTVMTQVSFSLLHPLISSKKTTLKMYEDDCA